MEIIPGEMQGAIFGAGVLLAGFVWGVIAYLRKNPMEARSQPAALHGAAIIDSSVGRTLVECMGQLVKAQVRTAEALEREASATESIRALLVDRDKQMEAERERHEMEELRREVAELKRLRDKSQPRRGG